jgi:hypothetical protein
MKVVIPLLTMVYAGIAVAFAAGALCPLGFPPREDV